LNSLLEIRRLNLNFNTWKKMCDSLLQLGNRLRRLNIIFILDSKSGAPLLGMN